MEVDSGKEKIHMEIQDGGESEDVRKVCVKRTGEIVPFDQSKIESAVRKAILVCFCFFFFSLFWICLLFSLDLFFFFFSPIGGPQKRSHQPIGCTWKRLKTIQNG